MVSKICGQLFTLGKGELFMTIPEKSFGDLSSMTVTDLLQLSPVRGKLIFSQFFGKDSMKNLLDCIYNIYVNV